jgi:hypothetical protein
VLALHNEARSLRAKVAELEGQAGSSPAGPAPKSAKGDAARIGELEREPAGGEQLEALQRKLAYEYEVRACRLP